jgi:threonine dehydrogenase-like Zn-dependent dehydrogenase
MKWLYGKQLTLIGAGYAPRIDCAPAAIRFNLRRNMEYIFALMQSGELNLEPIISHRLPATRMREAYDLAHAHSKEMVAAVFDWRNLA